MPDALPIVLVPGLNCSARLYADQIPALWRFGPVFVADHTRDDTIPAIARRILAAAPPRFALAGLSMGGYISFELMRQAPERVAKLALLDTGVRAESPEQTQMRELLRKYTTAAQGPSNTATRTAPTGQPRPLDRSSQRLSQSSPYCCALALLATTAFISRAPSICSDSPDSFTARETSLSAASDQIAPPPRFTVCST